jgi:hypothetical protein
MILFTARAGTDDLAESHAPAMFIYTRVTSVHFSVHKSPQVLSAVAERVPQRQKN